MKASKKSKIKGAQFYKIGDKVETIKTDIGAWFTADILDISPNSKCECTDECHCVYKLLFEGEDDDEVEIVDRKLSEIRQVSYSSISWDKLEVGMKVVINYNIDKPKQWGYWYDYIIDDLQKRKDVYFLKGTLLVGFEENCKKISVSIDSDNVADVLEIRPHTPLKEKEMICYETGVKPEYCRKCRNKPKVRCRSCCCCKCGTKKDFELTVQCDECADWYHIYCMTPPIKELPKDEDWYCPKCNNETHRAKMEGKLLKKQRKMAKTVRKNQLQNKKSFGKSLKIIKKSPEKTVRKNQLQNKKSVGNSLKIVKKSPEKTKRTPSLEKPEPHEDVGMQEETKKVPKDSRIWNQIKELFPGYDLVQVTAEVIRKKDSEKIISCAAEEFINKDILNEHLWQEAKNSLPNGKKAFLESVKRIFTCAICCELLNDPITLSCKHNFCIDCFFRSLSVNVYNCALCRVDVIHTQHYVVNENLKRALALLFEKKISKKIDA